MTNIMLAAMIGGWELLIVLGVIGFPAVVAAIVLAFYFAGRKKKSAAAVTPPPVPSSTVVLPRKCPKCGSELKPDVPEGLCPACLLQHGIATEAGPESKLPFTPPTLEELSKLFPQLEILGPIGKGGMGAVYKARQPALDRIVALKILAPRPGNELDFGSRFSREARALAKLNHPNIVAVYDFGVVSGVSPDGGASKESDETKQSGHRPDATPTSLSYFIMEYVDGPNLRQVQQAGRLAPREALEIIPQICAALQFAHDEGIVHRDIKPENVLLDKKGRVKIADFGLAKILGQEPKDFRLTGEKDVMGTPHYMAPEQIEKPQEVDHRADIYSLGVVFYEMLTGELPLGKFQSPSQKVQVDVRLDEVVMRALEKEPERRYQHASEFKTRVETIAANASNPVPPVLSAASRPRRKTVFVTVVVLVLIAILLVPAAIVGGFLFYRERQARRIHAYAVQTQAEAERQESVAKEQQELLEHTNAPAASAETWAPDLMEGQKPDLSKIREEANEFMSRGRYEQALQRHIWLFNHTLEYDKSFGAVRTSFMLSDWVELGRRYPKARQALIEIRDRDTRELVEGRGYSDLFSEVAALNRGLQAEDATYALYKTIRQNDPDLARQCYFYAEELLVKNGDYDICAQYMGSAKQRFDSLSRSFTMEMDSAQRTADFWKRTQQMNEQAGQTNLLSLPDSSEMMRTSAQDRFVKGTRQLIEILVATDRMDEADVISRAALATLADKRIESAIADACIKLGKLMPPVVAPVMTGATNRLVFRWVARDSETNLPADFLADPQDRTGQNKLRVLREVLMDETAISSAGFARYQPDQKEILVLLTDAGRRFFSTITETNINRQLAIVWNGRVLSAPVIRSAITGPSLSISGMFNDVEAEALLSVLNRRERQIVSNAPQSAPTNQPDGPPAPSPLDRRLRDIRARLDAAKSIMMFTERDAALVPIVKDAAATGNVELTKKAVMQITAFTTRDEAARAAARTLAATGHRAEALEIARTITAFTTRDETLRELAGK